MTTTVPFETQQVLTTVHSARAPRTLLASYARIHCVWLILYAFLGKGFAYAGWPPLYVSEMLGGFAIIALLSSGSLGYLIRTPLGALMTCFIGWQLLCTVPHFEAYGVDSMRDAVLWGYCLFAWVTAAAVLRLRGFLHTTVTNSYRRFANFYLVLGAAAWLLTLYFREELPHWPDTSVSIPQIKGGEYCVHIAGILAFALSGLTRKGPWIILIIADAILGIGGRGGLLAFFAAAAFILIIKPRIQRIFLLLASVVVIAVTMMTFDFRFQVPGTSRELSLSQLSDNMQSVIGNSDRQDLEGTKTWRLAWWRNILNYTLEGQYFWQGKGYGINLADSDGFQVGTKDEPLRSPHNSHLTFLARSGVPGFVLWVALQGLWLFQMLRSYVQASNASHPLWSSFFSWIVAYWIAFIVSASFDVFLEGPMAGIPFWSLFGLGWGGQLLFQHHLLQEHERVMA